MPGRKISKKKRHCLEIFNLSSPGKNTVGCEVKMCFTESRPSKIAADLIVGKRVYESIKKLLKSAKMSKIPLARKFFFRELKSEPETEIVYCGNPDTAKIFHKDLNLIERVKRSPCQLQVVCFVSHRSIDGF